MGLMKETQMAKISEFARKIGASERFVYENSFFYDLACLYAERELDRAMKKLGEILELGNILKI